MTSNTASPSLNKRIIVCCDGTWQDADSTDTTPSNVARIVRAIKPVGVDDKGNKISQVIYYQNGIGTGSAGWWQKHIGSKISGATGEGLIFNVREAYGFICSNYQEGDEIILLGFSRGAFTARSLGTLIHDLGLLTSKGIGNLVEVVDDWEHKEITSRKSPYPKTPWPNRPAFSSQAYKDKLIELKLTRPNIPIKCIAVWDTVGSLGIPSSAMRIFFRKIFKKICPKALYPAPKPKPFAFVDTEVLPNLEYAFHALALDEKRESFIPTIWHKPDANKGPILKQTWFAGVHSDVGGSYTNDDNALLTLAWMLGQFAEHKLVDFNENYVFNVMQTTFESHMMAEQENSGKKLPWYKALWNKFFGKDTSDTWGELVKWGTGKTHESYKSFFKLGGLAVRTPMQYTAISRGDMESETLLENTFETMHASVRVRCAEGTKDWTGHRLYSNSRVLKGWKWYAAEQSDPMTAVQQSHPGEAGRFKDIEWIKSQKSKNGEANVLCRMPEDKMTAFEVEVLQRWTRADEEDETLRREAMELISNKQIKTTITKENLDVLDVHDAPTFSEAEGTSAVTETTSGSTKPVAQSSVTEYHDQQLPAHLHVATDFANMPKPGRVTRQQVAAAAS